MNIFTRTTPPIPDPLSPILETPQHQLAFSLLKDYLLFWIKVIQSLPVSATRKVELLRDLRSYPIVHKNIGSITNPTLLPRVIEWLLEPNYVDSRQEFVIKATQYLRVQLGAKRWKALVIDIGEGISITSPKSETNRGFSKLNKELNIPRPETLEEEHWLVIIVMLVLSPDYYTDVLNAEMDLVAYAEREANHG